MSIEKPTDNKTPHPVEKPKNMPEEIPGNSYDKLYREKKAPFGSEAERVVKNIINWRSTGSVLELGAGDGRNALYLARQGFAVTAWDTSQVGLDILDQLAQENGLDFQTEIKDIGTQSSLGPDHHFDVFVCTYVLHHLSRQDALFLIEEMQKHTNTGGLNTIAAFTENSDFYRDNPETENFYLQENELQALYPESEWEILEDAKAETQALKKRPDRSLMINVSVELIAKKKEH